MLENGVVSSYYSSEPRNPRDLSFMWSIMFIEREGCEKEMCTVLRKRKTQVDGRLESRKRRKR